MSENMTSIVQILRYNQSMFFVQLSVTNDCQEWSNIILHNQLTQQTEFLKNNDTHLHNRR